MRYHFRITNGITDEVMEDSANFMHNGEPFKGFSTEFGAGVTASCTLADEYENQEGCYVYRVYEVDDDQQCEPPTAFDEPNNYKGDPEFYGQDWEIE